MSNALDVAAAESLVSDPIVVKALTQKQKTLLEKAVKLRYNGIIRQLNSVLTVTEKENAPISDYGIENNDNLPGSLRVLVDAVEIASERLSLALGVENDRRSVARTQAAKARLALVAKLEQGRDDAIMQVAFEGESNALAFLDNLPSPDSVTSELGMTLTKQLTKVTGIGERNPEALQS